MDPKQQITVKITPQQLKAIFDVKEDIRSMIGGGDTDEQWEICVRHINEFFKVNGITLYGRH